MKVYKLKVKLYNWNVIVIKIDSSDSNKDVKKAFKKADINKDLIKRELIRFKENKLNGSYSGHHVYNVSTWSSVVILNNVKHKLDVLKVLTHELDHVRFLICDYLCLEGCEVSAYIMHYLCKKTIPKFYK